MTNYSKSMKKFLATATATTIVAGVVAPMAFAANLTDIDGHRHEEAIKALVEKGIISGYEDNSFQPNKVITRAEGAIMIARALGLLDGKDIPENNFSDVGENSKAYEAIVKLADLNIVSGFGNGIFAPEKEITRGQMAKYIANAYELELGDGKTAFPDVAENAQLAKYVDAIADAGIAGGYENGHFGYNDALKRGDFAKMVYNAENFVKEVVTPAVESVSAINAKQMVVEFNTALAKGTTEANLISKFSLEGKKVVGAELSEDRTTVIYTLDSTEVDNAIVTVLPLDTDLKDGEDKQVQTEKFVSLLTFDDVVAPSVVETSFDNYNEAGTTADATITFDEALSTVGTVSVNGVQAAPVVGTDSFTLKGLEVGKTYTLDIVGAKDTASPANKAEHLTLSFTVLEKEVDSTIPTVSTSTNGNKLTLTFSEEVQSGTVTIGGVAVKAADITSTDKKTFVIDVQQANDGDFFASNTDFFTSEVVVNGFTDGENEMKEVKFNSTFTADRTAASLAGASATENGKIVLEFNEEVAESAINKLTVKTIDGIIQSATTLDVTAVAHPTVDGEEVLNKLEFTLDEETPLQVGKKYVIEVAKDAVADKYDNTNENAINFSVVRPAAASVEAGEVITTSITNEDNVIEIVFDETDDKGMSDSVLAASNYTIGGKALPAGTDIKFVDNKNKVRITLPESFITVNGAYTFVASNLVDVFGNTLKEGENTAELTLTENVAPTATALTVNGSNQVVVSFSEAVKSNDLDGDQKEFEGITLKVNGTTATFTNSVDSTGKLVLALNEAIKTTDKVTVEFDNAELTDANNNQVKNASVNN
ncbi:S-layer homology domain-containing protein [Niallia endozanthoxylica]|uniref:S-layer homology domain-containing protein n=1 Tax=Niallia endozanthoxylica TaxID=2036016 RepID=A0A5J5H4H1_9BACI|nr:S-layer homology domain-containing protein [Niallia endozanthoxylica]KAA9015491.1 S-layer homology domain-containing protein [Niallia endozanthoxylica]